MKIVFISNFVSHHQQPFCEELEKKSSIDFYFISLAELNNEKQKLGWKVNKNQFEIKASQSKKNLENSIRIIQDSDIIILSQQYISEWIDVCLKNKNAIIFEYGERLFKGGKYKVFSPKGIIYRIKYYYLKNNKRRFILCSSAYTASDLAICGLFINKCYKWGYFPKTYTYDIGKIIKNKKKNRILWVGRLIKWKHPEIAIILAKKLKENNISFVLEIIGDGVERKNLINLVKKYNLDDYIKFLGTMSPKNVREEMLSAGIFLATSDSNEGWGAVINEAMNSGCAVVASKSMGSVPFLIKNNYNGLSYKYRKNYLPYKEIVNLLVDHQRQEIIGKNAYITIKNEWNEKIAAERFITLSKGLLKKQNIKFNSGPCSNAKNLIK